MFHLAAGTGTVGAVFDMTGQAAVITGGTRGIGFAIAQRFLEAGADVLVSARNEPDALPEANGRTAKLVITNLRDSEQCKALIDGAADRFGRLDVVVNNAGGSPEAAAATASPRFSRAIVELNLLAPLDVAQAANRVMQTQAQGGVIVNIASVSGVRPSPGTAAYGAAKAGLLSLTASLAIEWAPKVRVVAVTAGMVQTDAAVDHYGGAEGIDRVAATVPNGRLALPDDVAAAVLFLASTAASHITGTSLVVDGGGERPAFLGAAAPD